MGLMKPSALAALAAGLIAIPVIATAITPGAPARASLPDPALDSPLAPGPERTAVLAGGCFWGMEAIYEEMKGVREVVTGYAGGTAATAGYKQVSAGSTGHAEGIRITYDPARVTYGQLLKVYFAVAHDPTQLNRQGPDVGPQYRSAIFPTTARQQKVATAYIQQLDAAEVFDKPIATTVEASTAFYPAEPYHQNYVERNPANPYVVVHDLPKLARFKKEFPELVK